MVAHDDVVEHAIPILRLALAHRPARDDVVRRRHRALVDVVDRRHFQNTVQQWAIVAGVVALIGLLVALIVRRRRRRRAAAAATA
jgi:LPXTG-motif cell wall-anchored protein